MNLRITGHAKKRMKKYDLSRSLVVKTMKDTDSVVDGHSGRKIAQKKLNGYVLRVIYEQEKGINVIVTIYKAKSERYEI